MTGSSITAFVASRLCRKLAKSPSSRARHGSTVLAGKRDPSTRPARALVTLAAFALAALAGFGGAAAAQTYPARPIMLVAPFAAGGPSDVVARIVAEHMARTLGQAVTVENVVGAGGTTGSNRVMRANPDGYTVVIGNTGTHGVAVALYPNLSYRPELDFSPIGVVVEQPMVVVARKDLPPANLQEFVAYLRANGDRLNMAHSGVGSLSFSYCLLLNSIIGAKPTSVPFSGGSQAMNALVGGQVDYFCEAISNVIAQVESGTVKAYAIGSADRNPALPTVPTAREAGLPQFRASAWYALFAPKGTPKPVVDKLAQALDSALGDDKVRKRLVELGCDIPPEAERGPAPLAALVRRDIALWTPIIKAVNSNGP
jgi:tripartite-type tricarboxylate transporter receptor subunit TctC